MNTPLQVAIVGSSGYTGEELIKVCLRHSGIQLSKITSRQFAGKRLGDVLGFKGKGADLVFEDLGPDQVGAHAEVVFLALPHGVAAEYAIPLLKQGKTVIDLSADFRLKDKDVYKEFYGHDHPAPELLAQSVYGSPELYAPKLKNAQLIACPGCYPTSIQLALAPALRLKAIDAQQIVINSLSGVSGAGKKADIAYLYCECNESLKAYGVGKHRHLPEIEQELGYLAGAALKVSFTPHLIPITRGMLSTISAPGRTTDMASLRKAYQEAYSSSPFVRFLSEGQFPETRRVAGTNKAEVAIHHDPRTGRILFISAIDNLGKGAAGQAVECFNVRFGFPQEEGLS